jgi:hypothetical protein
VIQIAHRRIEDAEQHVVRCRVGVFRKHVERDAPQRPLQHPAEGEHVSRMCIDAYAHDFAQITACCTRGGSS